MLKHERNASRTRWLSVILNLTLTLTVTNCAAGHNDRHTDRKL